MPASEGRIVATRLLQRSPQGVAPAEAGVAFFRETQLALRHAGQTIRSVQQARLSGQRGSRHNLRTAQRGSVLPLLGKTSSLSARKRIAPPPAGARTHGLRSTLDAAFARDCVTPNLMLE